MKWIKVFKNQVLTFFLTVMTLPLLLLGQCTLLTGSITVGAWVIGCLLIYWLWKRSF